MCSEPNDSPRAHSVLICGPDCCTGGLLPRRFISSKEKKERLEEYRDQLEKELAGVQERIKDLEGK
jgi:hypothetical protein